MIARACQGVASRVRRALLRLRGARIPHPVWLRAIEVPRQAQRIELRAGAGLDRGVALVVSGDPAAPPCITIGERVYINRYTILDASIGLAIGDDCMIGPFCYLTDHDHTFGADLRPAAGPLLGRPTTLEPGCWLGAHVTVLKGVTIGAGTVVGAGSVVTRDLPAGVIAVGSPARVLKSRAQGRP